MTGTATTKNRQKTRNDHSASTKRFFYEKNMAVLPISPAEHARVHPLALLVGTDEDGADSIPDLFHAVAVREGRVERVETPGDQGLVDLPENVAEDKEVPDHHAEREGKLRRQSHTPGTFEHVVEFCRGREQDDGRDADNELHEQDKGKLNGLRVDMDAERQVGDDVEDRIIPVGEKDLEDDDEEAERQDHAEALCIDKPWQAGESPERDEERQKKQCPTVKTSGEYGTATIAMMTANMPRIFTRASSWWMKLSRYADFSM